MRRWREANRDHLREYNRRWRDKNLERSRQQHRESERRARERERARREKRERDRDYYAANAEKRRAYAREWRAARMAADPEGFRDEQNAQRRAWWHRQPLEERQRIARTKHELADPEEVRERGRAYYHRNADRLNEQRRAHLKAHPEKRREYQYRWRDKERRRIAAGLPKPTRHRTTKQERAANRAAADAFFRQTYTAEQIEKMRQGPPTPPELLYAFNRDCRRARAAHQLAVDAELQARLTAALTPTQRAAAEQEHGERERQRAEEERLDAIGRAINDRLRHTAPPRRQQRDDPAAPHPMLQHPHGTGLNR
jgi:hypothetical protein